MGKTDKIGKHSSILLNSSSEFLGSHVEESYGSFSFLNSEYRANYHINTDNDTNLPIFNVIWNHPLACASASNARAGFVS